MFVLVELASGESVLINPAHVVLAVQVKPGISKLTLRATITHGASLSIEVNKTLEEIAAWLPSR